MTILGLLLAGALGARAHEYYPIRPVRATLRVEPSRVVADLRADSIIWILEIVGLNPMPPRGWSKETTAKIEAYVNAHFPLTIGGRPAEGRLADGRYRQLPWEVNEEGELILRFVYPGAPAGSAIAGQARFYEDYRREIESELGGRPLPDADGYRTVLTVPGRRKAEFTLTAASPSFSIPADDARRTAPAMALESAGRGFAAALATAAGFPAVLAIALCLGARPSGRAAAAALGAAAAGYAAGGFLPAPPWLVWAGGLGAALAAGRGKAAAAGAAAAACAGLAWRGAAAPFLPASALAAPFSLAGALASGTGLLLAAALGVRAERRRLAEHSESRVEELFARRTRLAATALVIVAAYGLWQSLQR